MHIRQVASIMLLSGISSSSAAAAAAALAPEYLEPRGLHRNLIIGGHDAREGRYPYFAVFDHFGGGFLIAPDIILTAGHVDPPPTQAVRVRLNHTSFAHTDFAQEPDDDETFSIVHKEHHPKYAYIGWDERIFDFNIFKISGLSNVKPVKLNTNPNIPKPGQIVTVIGMGSTKPDPETFVSSAATTLQEVDLTILSQQQCEASADPNRPGSAYKGRVYETIMVCSSGGKHNEKDACAFDSGSPLLLTPSNSKNVTEDTVVALVSWGENCADPFFPAVNARVSIVMDWIGETVCKLSDADPSLLKEWNCEAHSKSISSFWNFAHWRPGQANLTGQIIATGNQGYALERLYIFAGLLLVLVGFTINKVRKRIVASEQVPLNVISANDSRPHRYGAL